MFTKLPLLGTHVCLTPAPLLSPEGVLARSWPGSHFSSSVLRSLLFARLRNLGFLPVRAPLVPPLGYSPSSGRGGAGDRDNLNCGEGYFI